MQLKIFTLPFDEEIEGFPDEIITEFCRNKKVLRIEPQFFLREGMPFWSVAVHYQIVLPDTDKLRELVPWASSPAHPKPRSFAS